MSTASAMPSAQRNLAGLAALLSSHLLVGSGATVISGLACGMALDDVRPGTLFAPLDRSSDREAEMAAQAVAHGAVALLLEHQLDLPVPQLVVPSVRPALAQIAAAFYDFPASELRCIGVTGTAGKTSTTFLIDAILRDAGERPGLIGTLEWRTGVEWIRHQRQRTTPEAPQVQRLLRRMADAGDRWAILEASSQGLAQHRLDAVPFAIGAVTSITQDHLDFHGSVEAYRQAKAILFERVAESGGTAVINVDDPVARTMREYVGSGAVITYSAENQAGDIRVTDIVLGQASTRLTVAQPDGATELTLPLLGAFNVTNALCAAAVAYAAGISFAQIARALAVSSPIPGRMAPVDAGQPFLVIVDKAQSPAHLAGALDVARQLSPDGRVIVVVGGSDAIASALVRQKGEVAALAADFAVFTTEHARVTAPDALVELLAAGARSVGGTLGASFVCLEERTLAIDHALRLAQPGDCVLLVGKSDEDTFTIGRDVCPWDESAIAHQLLAAMGYRVSA